MSLIEKLNAVKVKKQADKDTIAEAINFIQKIYRYNEIQEEAFRMIGYEPIIHTEDEENGEGV